MKNNITTAIIASLCIALTGCATAPQNASGERIRNQTYYVDACVTKVEKAPQICDYGDKKSKRGSPLLGGLIGGVVGNQFGSGGGKKAATVVGAAAGALIATEKDPRRKAKTMKCRSDGYIASVQYLHPVTEQIVFTEVPIEKKIRIGREMCETTINIPVNVSVAE